MKNNNRHSNVVNFRAKDESSTDNSELLGFFNLLFEEEEPSQLVLLSKKPMTYMVLPDNDVKVLLKNRKNVESDDFKVLTSKNPMMIPHEDGLFRVVCVFNMPKLREHVDKNIDNYRYVMSDKDISADEVVKKITSQNSTLVSDNKPEALVGLTLGYPVQDVLMHDLMKQAQSMSIFLKSKGRFPNQQGVIKNVLNDIRPDLYPNRSDLKTNVSGVGNRFFYYMTWAPQSKYNKPVFDEIKDASIEAESKFPDAESFLKYACYKANSN